MTQRESNSSEKSSLTGVSGTQALLGLIAGLVIVGTLIETPLVSVTGVLMFMTLAGVIVLSSVLADDTKRLGPEKDPVTTSNPRSVGGIVTVISVAIAVTFIFGLQVVAMLGALVLLAIGGILMLSWTLDSGYIANTRP